MTTTKAAAKPKAAAPRAVEAKPADEPKAADDEPKAAAKAKPEAPKGKTLIYPTHRLQRGPLVVHLPGGINDDGDSESGEITITSKGAVVDDALADVLIASRDATTKSPEED